MVTIMHPQQRTPRRPRGAKSSRYRGVSWDTRNRRWRVQLRILGKTVHVGLFDFEQDAAVAHDRAAYAAFGERATLNFPQDVGEQRAAAHDREQAYRLLRNAQERDLRATPDYCHPDQWIVWEPGLTGCCELVNAERCTCRRFQVFGRCEHHALVMDQLVNDDDRQVA